MIYFWILEDFLWFICNPVFGWSKFGKEYINWHQEWWWLLPRSYWLGACATIALLIVSYLL